ncbi:tellurite resistance/C4-dicarboxylate transporter family protein [Streptomyces monticola]|uniref:Tellurite resistance/C4-dicarboxylate transporter family protein n=1 Tax=Streptomyces monticola TaxID=2666263 RepID=A0ABW2JDQ7_9ACTN
MSEGGGRTALDAARRGVLGWWQGLTPASGSAVMATGIVSVGLHLAGHETLSRMALALAVLAWAALAALFARRLLRDRSRWARDADTPAALTAVAATTVIGTRLSLLGPQPVAVVLLVLAVVLWPALMVSVVRHWGRHMPGAVFLSCVATQGIAVLAATLAPALPAAWLAYAALVFFCLGLVLYAACLPHFDLGHVRAGAGDQWVAGGALAISALAGAKLVAAPQWHGGPHQVLRIATLVLLALVALWYAVLLVSEVRHPRPRYDVRRWATVFPMGMTAVATLTTSTAAQLSWLRGPGQVLLWVAVAAWLLTCAGLLGSVRGRGTAPGV